MSNMRSEDFEVKDIRPKGMYGSGMVREDEGDRPRFDLLVIEDMPYEHQPLTRWAALLAKGAKKYSARNWEKANSPEELERFKSSAFRHFMQWMAGEKDEDHLTMAWFNMMAADCTEWKLNDKLPSDK